jgi:hypothetical protein
VAGVRPWQERPLIFCNVRISVLTGATAGLMNQPAPGFPKGPVPSAFIKRLGGNNHG